jgi:hypothetical protein
MQAPAAAPWQQHFIQLLLRVRSYVYIQTVIRRLLRGEIVLPLAIAESSYELLIHGDAFQEDVFM